MARQKSTTMQLIIAVLATFFALFWSDSVAAQPADKSASLGSIVANMYAQVPDRSAISIEFKEDTELNAKLLPIVQEELQEHGHSASPDASLVLWISLNIETDAPPEGRVGLSGRGDKRGLSDAQVTVKVDRSSKTQAKKTRYRLETDLIDQKTKPIWKGAASIAVESGRDRREISEMIVRSLMAEFSTTVRNKPIVE